MGSEKGAHCRGPLWDQETEPWGLVMTYLVGCV